jgi:hypothetical protein
MARPTWQSRILFETLIIFSKTWIAFDKIAAWQVECDNVQTVPCRMDDNEWWGYPGYVARVHRAVL